MTTQDLLDLDWQPRARAFAQHLAETGAILDPAWRRVIAAVPRHRFVPSFWALDGYNSPDHEISGEHAEQRDDWLDAVYRDQILVTQWAPGMWKGTTPIRIVTSSASQPTVVATMLERLQVDDGDTVLEIGTGTGYNAALLCARVGSGRVTSIDIDPQLVHTASERLTAAGYRPTLHTGDGAAAVPGEQQFDRIIATCSVPSIPPAWITQLTPGGRLVVPLRFGSALAVLDKTGPDQVTGRIDPCTVAFMGIRDVADQPLPRDGVPPIPDPDPAATHLGLTDLDPAVLDDTDFQLWLALHDPTLRLTHHYRNGTPDAAIVYNAEHRAVIELVPDPDGLWQVRQQPGRPWDTVEAAWRTFRRTGCPGRDRLGLTARTDVTQHLWLDEPASAYTWPIPRQP